MPLRHQAEPYQAVPANGAHLRPDGVAALLGPSQGSVRRRCHQSWWPGCPFNSLGSPVLYGLPAAAEAVS